MKYDDFDGDILRRADAALDLKLRADETRHGSERRGAMTKLEQLESSLDRDRTLYIDTIGEGDVKAQERARLQFRRSLKAWLYERDRKQIVESFRILEGAPDV